MSSHPALDDFHFGAPVFTADGVHVGELHRLILDEESLDPHAIVVKETRHFSGHNIAGAALIEDARKTPDELEITPGENIMLDRTGRKLGTVRDVVFDGDEVIGVVTHPAGFFKEDVLLHVRFLGRCDDLALFAHLTEDYLQHRRPFHPE